MLTLLRRASIIGLGLLVLWTSLVIYFQLPDYILPTPYQVFLTLYQEKNVIFYHAGITILETGIGLVCGILFGGLTAWLMIFFRPLREWILPMIIISQATPTFAIAPLLVIWLGYGLSSKIVIITLMIFFPITSAFYDGLKATPIAWLELAKTMNASRWRIFFYVRMPAALPSFASGIRIAAVIAPIGAIVGEWVGSSKGLGYLMLNANARLQIDDMFAVLIIIVLLTLLLYFSIDRLLHMLVWWKI